MEANCYLTSIPTLSDTVAEINRPVGSAVP